MDPSIIQNMNDVKSLPENVMGLHDESFFNLVSTLCGDVVSELFRVQSINTAKTLLRVVDVFSVLDLDCRELDDIRVKTRFILSDGTTMIKPGIKNNVNYIIELFRFKEQQLQQKQDVNYEKDMIYKLIQNNNLLKSLVLFHGKNETFGGTKETFLATFIDNIQTNLCRPINNYRYHELVERFAVALYILGSRYTYEFVRLNLVYALPCPTTINNLIRKSNLKLKEAEFRFDLLHQYFTSKNLKYGFVSEDSSTIIKKIIYDKDTNSFVGFCTPLHNGVPVARFFRTESFDQLKEWFDNVEKASFLNLQMVQPISELTTNLSPLMLAAYGLDNKFTLFDVVHKWAYIFDECFTKNIRIVGFSTGNIIQLLFL